MYQTCRLLFIVVLLICLGSCQREYSFENPPVSDGVLLKDIQGNCDSIGINGTITANTALTDSNFLEVRVSVTKTGSYSIKSDTINGYSFQKEGDFKTVGNFVILLPGAGTSLDKGTDHFTIRYAGSICEVDLTTLKDLHSPAVVTLAGAPVECFNPILSGDFVKAYALDSNAIVELKVQVVEPGTYSVSTETINGYRFTGSGTLTQTGTQKIQLRAEGTPVNAASDVFTASLGTSSCSFEATVLEPVAAADLDHFPLTEGSFWIYDYIAFGTDSLTRRVAGTSVQDTTLYKLVQEQRPFGIEKDLYFRKISNVFLEYSSLDKYTEAFTFVPGTNGEILFLRENISTGAYWESPPYLYRASFGQLVQVQYQYYCINANAGVVVNGKAFANVYKIQMYPVVGSENVTGGFSGEAFDFWFAKGIGLIYQKKTKYGTKTYEQKIRRWQVN